MISQYYGAEDHKTCQGLFSLQVFLSLAISVVFFVLLQLLPRQIMGLFVKDENTILLGLSYLAVVSVSYLPTSISNVCVLSLRSIGLEPAAHAGQSGHHYHQRRLQLYSDLRQAGRARHGRGRRGVGHADRPDAGNAGLSGAAGEQADVFQLEPEGGPAPARQNRAHLLCEGVAAGGQRAFVERGPEPVLLVLRPAGPRPPCPPSPLRRCAICSPPSWPPAPRRRSPC